MNQQRIILESSPLYIIVCIILAGGIAALLYFTNKNPWSKPWNYILPAARFILTFLLLFLLLGPVVKQIRNFFEKPLVVILHDNSASIPETNDTVKLNQVRNQLVSAKNALSDKGFEVVETNLSGNEPGNLNYDALSTDLHAALKEIVNTNEGRTIHGVILPTDGIYNSGLSPLYGNYNFPVYTVGLGDTLVKTDLGIKNVAYNRIAYQGNKFPVRVEVLAKNISNESVTVTLSQRGKVLEQVTKKSGTDQLLTFDFQPLAAEKGIQKLDVQVSEKADESNKRNNRSSVFIDVVEGKKKILLVASSPHPDIKPIREVIEQNANYEFILTIPGITKEQRIEPNEIDLVIFHQVPDVRGRTNALFQQYIKTKASLLIITGQQSDLRNLSRSNMPLQFDSPPRDYDQVTPVVNVSFQQFSLSPEAISVLQDYPPVSVHFGRLKIPLTATALLYQKIGNVATEKPLLAIDQQNSRKIGILLGEGTWRWRLNEFDRTEKTTGFDELFSKLIQYLSTTEDRRKFKSYPIQQDFSDAEPVVFESQVYNDLFEPVYGNNIEIDITNESGEKKSYNYVTSPGNTRYQIGGLKEGVYKYRSRTSINNKPEEVRGEFAVVARQAEQQNLTADFDLLRKLSANTGGKFYRDTEITNLQDALSEKEAKSIIHSEERFDSLVNLKWVFWILLMIISLEWFARKYHGSY